MDSRPTDDIIEFSQVELEELYTRIKELEAENAQLRKRRKPRTYTRPGFHAEDPLAGKSE